MKVIVVQTNGFVLIGEQTGNKNEDGFNELTEASIIRKWGTTKGLGEIALNGETITTILDYEGVVYYNPSLTLRIILCAI